jgi:hypothetical protein
MSRYFQRLCGVGPDRFVALLQIYSGWRYIEYSLTQQTLAEAFRGVPETDIY